MYRLCGHWQLSRQIWTIFWSKNDSNYLDLKFKVFRKDDKKEFRLVQNLTMGEAYLNQFMRLRNQLVNAAENFAREEHLTPVLIPTMSKDMDEQLKLPHKVVDVVDRAKRKICVKSVFTFQPIKQLVTTTVKSAKPAATFRIFLLRTKNR